MRYYAVSCLRGHCGARHSQEITFVFCAKDMAEAMEKARKMPSIKHHNNACVIGAREISAEEYVERRKISAYRRMG